MNEFKITKAAIEEIIEEWRILFKCNYKKWEVKVLVTNGVIPGDHTTNVSTSDIYYFDLPDEVRKNHFELIKAAINDKRRNT